MNYALNFPKDGFRKWIDKNRKNKRYLDNWKGMSFESHWIHQFGKNGEGELIGGKFIYFYTSLSGTNSAVKY